ncbi:MAG: ATP-binding cassette domain-containing protein, partial [Peptococcaceae bacterium]|nr:ATP-binding cassette domain-containing protein [Peptococcaceae bacterium]
MILKNIDWQVEAGEHWIILGLNGCGKTTLLEMINGYIFPMYG